MVFDVPAENGGALTILKMYYERAIKDQSKNWVFVISTPELVETKNIKVIRLPWIKKSWFHRLFFDFFVAHRIVDAHNPDEILSLQNMLIRRTGVRQTVYLHQSLPFAKKRYGFVEDPKYWVYQNIVGPMIYRSIAKADTVIVQTNWMKKACLDKVQTEPQKILVESPFIDIQISDRYQAPKDGWTYFFYPASAASYKNHEVIVKAVLKLVEENVGNFSVVFTLNGNETKHIGAISSLVKDKDLPIEFVGQIDLKKVYRYYSHSVLVFPSLIETFGLPILEAKMHGAPILASNLPFAKEILDGYERCSLFDPNNATQLAELMKKFMCLV